MRTLIRLAAPLIAVALILGAFAAPSQAAAPASSSAVATSKATPKAVTAVTVKRKAEIDATWTGWNIKFNRSETRGIAAGAGSCSVIVSKFTWGIAKPLSAACGLMAVLAGYALSDGRCLTAGVYYWGAPNFGTWRC